jgi:hypothetical protein
MNEVLAVLYYCFQRDQDLFCPEQREADSFVAFSNMMEVMRDSFLRELDKEDVGLEGRLKHYAQVLEHADPELFEVIEDNEVPHAFYAMRWFMLLMCQDFGMAETMRLWDSLIVAVGPKSGQN